MFYTFVAKMISDTAGSKAKPYFPFIFSLFMFVLFVTGGYASIFLYSNKSHNCYSYNGFIYIFSCNGYWFIKHGFKYLSIFVPAVYHCAFAFNYYYRNYILFK